MRSKHLRETPARGGLAEIRRDKIQLGPPIDLPGQL